MAWLITRLGWFTAGYAIISTVTYVLIPFDLRLDFLYYLGWSVLAISSFVRYMTRPTTVDESEQLSRAFVGTFGITTREEEVVRLVGQGLTNQEIADRLGISFGTVRTHVHNIFQKTGAGSRVDLLRLVRGYRE
jgi:DNA-binding CsgD family transcriptional regulator